MGFLLRGLGQSFSPLDSRNSHDAAEGAPSSHAKTYHIVQQDYEFFWREQGRDSSVHHILPHSEAERAVVQGGHHQGNRRLSEPLGHLSLIVQQLGLRRHKAESWLGTLSPKSQPIAT